MKKLFYPSSVWWTSEFIEASYRNMDGDSFTGTQEHRNTAISPKKCSSSCMATHKNHPLKLPTWFSGSLPGYRVSFSQYMVTAFGGTSWIMYVSGTSWDLWVLLLMSLPPGLNDSVQRKTYNTIHRSYLQFYLVCWFYSARNYNYVLHFCSLIWTFFSNWWISSPVLFLTVLVP